MGYIYKIEGPINLPNENKIYVGQTIIPLNQRWGNHKVAFKHFAAKTPNMSFCNKLCRAVMKYNVENFKISLVEKCNDDILNDKEIYWIKELNTIYPNGYNVQFGGRSTVQNERTKKKIAKGLLKSISIYLINIYQYIIINTMM
jgi:group I intron endonuclease